MCRGFFTLIAAQQKLRNKVEMIAEKFFFYYFVYVISFLAAGACLGWGLPSHSSKRPSSQAAYMDH